jgi:tripartite-type tricarboxylate transporter receptor subunit TctC
MSVFTRIMTLALASLLGLSATAQAQDYPTRAVEFIVPWSPGGGSDTLMRIVSNHIEPYLGQPLPVINMPGVSGTVGLQEASERAADGYTVAQVHEGLMVSHATGVTDINWNDFEPVAAMTSSPQFLVVNAERPWQTLDDLIAHARDNPGAVKIGVTLAGVPHLHAAMIEDAAGIEFSYVGFEGTGERIRNLVGGHIDAAIGDVASAQEFVRNGDLRFLAVGSAERMEQTPEVPTFKELGYDMELSVNRGIVAPKGTPAEHIAVLEEALRQTSEDEDFRAGLQRAGAEPIYRGSAAYREYLEQLDATVQRLSSKLQG